MRTEREKNPQSSSLDSQSSKYQKTCKYVGCQSRFEHESRNKRYCSSDCEKKALGQARGREKSRRKYKKSPERFRNASLSRKQAREYAVNNLVVYVCCFCGKLTKLADMDCHHRDGDHTNNTADNLALVCREGCHDRLDSEWRRCKKESLPIPDCRIYTASVTPSSLKMENQKNGA